jgi:hypothetical protein
MIENDRYFVLLFERMRVAPGVCRGCQLHQALCGIAGKCSGSIAFRQDLIEFLQHDELTQAFGGSEQLIEKLVEFGYIQDGCPTRGDDVIVFLPKTLPFLASQSVLPATTMTLVA